MKEETIYARCICGNKSGFDKESLKASTISVNGQDIVLCCDCEDELRDKLNQRYDNLVLKIYWAKTDNGKILIDEDSLRDEFEQKLKELLDANKGSVVLRGCE